MEGKEALEELVVFQRLSEQMRVHLDPDKIASSLFEVLRRFLSIKNIGLYVFREMPDGFIPVGPGSLELIDQAISLRDEGVVEWAFEHDHTVFTPSPSVLGFEEKASDELLLAPLSVGTTRVGVLFATLKGNSEEITQFRQTVISLAINQAAVSIKNAYDYIEAESAKSYLGRILETVLDIIYTTDAAGIITFVNKRIDLFGFKPERIHGQPVYTLIPIEEDQGRTVQVLNEGKNFEYEAELETKNGRALFHIHQVPLRNAQNEITGSLGIIRDITTKHLLEEESLRRKRLEALTEAAISINHELNNPLTVIHGNLFMLENIMPLEDYPQVEQIISVLKKHSERISEVVQKFDKIEEMSSVEYHGNLKMLNIHDISDEDTTKQVEPVKKSKKTTTGKKDVKKNTR